MPPMVMAANFKNVVPAALYPQPNVWPITYAGYGSETYISQTKTGKLLVRSSFNVFLMEPNGNVIWSYRVDGMSYCLLMATSDTAGNVYVAHRIAAGGGGKLGLQRLVQAEVFFGLQRSELP